MQIRFLFVIHTLLVYRSASVWMQRLNHNFADDTVDPSWLLRGVADVGGRRKRRGAPDERKLTAVSSVSPDPTIGDPAGRA